jgi:hypothetical protein
MRLPTTSYHHGYSSNCHGSSAGVKSHFLPPIPGWEVKTYHYTHHTTHYFATDHPRGRIRQGPYPHDLGDSALSTRPRPVLDPPPVNKEERPTWHRTRSLFTVSSSTSPWCPGMVGHFRGTSLQPPPQGSTKLHLKSTPGVPASSYPIKGQVGALREEEQWTTDNEKPVSIPPKKINISSNLLCTLIFPLRPGLGSLSHSL